MISSIYQLSSSYFFPTQKTGFLGATSRCTEKVCSFVLYLRFYVRLLNMLKIQFTYSSNIHVFFEQVCTVFLGVRLKAFHVHSYT